MNWLKSIFSRNVEHQLTIRFSKDNNAWMVVRRREIVYIGAHSQCKSYIFYCQGREN